MQKLATQSPESTQDFERSLIVEQVRRFGGSFSDAVLDPLCTIFAPQAIDGLIGYRIESSVAVVFGDPVSAPSAWPELVSAFHNFCREQGMRIIYIGTTAAFAHWTIKYNGGALVEFGEELILDPHNDPKALKGEDGHVVRRKVKHAHKEGLEVNEYLHKDAELEKSMEHATQAWLESRHGPQIHVAHIHLFQDPIGKRWFYAHQAGKVVGVAQLSQIQAREGWLFSYLTHTPEAPHGTPELLMTSALEALAQEGCSFITLGATTLKKLGEIQGLGKLSTGLARFVFKTANKFFKLDSRGKFLHKFHPQSEPLFVLFSRPRVGLSELSALKRALNVQIYRSS